MEKFVYTNPIGNTITLDYSGSYLIDSYDGLTAADIEPITIKGYNQNGYTLCNLNYGLRHINLNFLMTASSAEEFYQKRKELASIFNPLLGEGVLTYTNNYLSKSIRCYPSVTPTPTERMGLAVLVNVELTATNPFWFDTDESAMLLEGFIGGLTFPLKFDEPKIFANQGVVGKININGDIPSPIRAEFKNEAIKPKLILDNTGEFIEVDTTLAANEKLIITTEYGNKNVMLRRVNGNEESAYHLINSDSTFFSLPLGNNSISFSAVAGTPEVSLYWRNYYVGV